MVLIYRSPDAALLEHMSTVLADHMIPCFTKNTNPNGPNMGMPSTLCSPEIWLQDESHLAHAMELITAYTSPYGGANWTCRQCSESLPGSFIDCWRCVTAGERA